MKCCAATSLAEDLHVALDECLASLQRDLDGDPVHLLLAFLSPHHGDEADTVRGRLVDELDPQVLLGCPATGVIGAREEIEKRPGLTLLAGSWPGVELVPIVVKPVDGVEEPTLEGWPDPQELPDDAGLLLLTDPYAAPESVLLGDVVARYPGRVLVGGVASSTAGPGFGQLITRDAIQKEGLVGVAIGGSVALEAVVSQGCRPVGRHFVITAAHRHLIRQLGGQPALDQLEAVLQEVDDDDRRLMQAGALHIGRVVDERKSRFQTRDLLVRNLLGIQPEERAIAISDHVRAGQTVQFMVRDPATASAELRDLLGEQRDRPRPLGAVLFSCNGRGRTFFGKPHHDVALLQDHLGPLPAAGFFAAGELGPVGGRPFLHGLTASIALFRPR